MKGGELHGRLPTDGSRSSSSSIDRVFHYHDHILRVHGVLSYEDRAENQYREWMVCLDTDTQCRPHAADREETDLVVDTDVDPDREYHNRDHCMDGDR